MQYYFKQIDDEIQIVLPVAIPVNRKYVYKTILSKQYRQYKKQIDDLFFLYKSKIKTFPKTYVKNRFVKDLHVEILLKEKDNRRDIDACLKIIFDSLNGKAFEDDSQIKSLVVMQEVSKEPCVVIHVSKVS